GLSFASTPASAVTSILAGPPGTLVAGYVNGFLGIWSIKNGALLDSAKLHGPLLHLLYLDRRLYAVTELGDALDLDLAAFTENYCELVRRMWQAVPVAWEDGLPVLRPPPARHCCLAGGSMLR
ncbi:MAG: hypothetical protein V2A73_16190, partial [Pseudomonadota bacterium]